MPTVFSPTLGRDVHAVEIPGSPHEVYQAGQAHVVRTFDVPWDERWHFAAAMIGYPVLAPDGSGGQYIKRHVPNGFLDWPDLRGQPWLFATQVQSIEGRGPRPEEVDPEGTGRYEKARVQILYESLNYTVKPDEECRTAPIEILGGLFREAFGLPAEQVITDESLLKRYVTRQIQPTAEALILPRGAFKWTGQPTPGVPVANTNTRIQPSAEVVYTWHHVPGIPQAARDLLGSVNSTQFDPLLKLRRDVRQEPVHAPQGGVINTIVTEEGFAPETLLLTGVEVKPHRSIVGVKVYDVVYKFKHLDQKTDLPDGVTTAGHNYFLRYITVAGDPTSNRVEYQLITRTGTANGRRVFAANEFRLLFQGPFIRDPDQEFNLDG